MADETISLVARYEGHNDVRWSLIAPRSMPMLDLMKCVSSSLSVPVRAVYLGGVPVEDTSVSLVDLGVTDDSVVDFEFDFTSNKNAFVMMLQMKGISLIKDTSAYPWECTICTYTNVPSLIACEMCDTPRMGSMPSPPARPPAPLDPKTIAAMQAMADEDAAATSKTPLTVLDVPGLIALAEATPALRASMLKVLDLPPETSAEDLAARVENDIARTCQGARPFDASLVDVVPLKEQKELDPEVIAFALQCDPTLAAAVAQELGVSDATKLTGEQIKAVLAEIPSQYE